MTTVATRTITYVDPELVEDNPFQARQVYHRDHINEIAASIEQHGLRQIPEAREKDGKVQLAYGHVRKRAFIKLKKKDPAMWCIMPLEVKELTDEQMFYFALEENLRRGDLTPMDTARTVDLFLTTFPDKKEQEIADKLQMTKGNVSNMRRVLRLPPEILEKIDAGRINFTMGRELLIFCGGPDAIAVHLMREAIKQLRTEQGTSYSGFPCTVEGIIKSIHDVASRNFRPLEKDTRGYSRYDPLFDTRGAGCLKCFDMITTHYTKSQASHWCTNKECWDGKQQAHKDLQAQEAKRKMTEDVFLKIASVEVARETEEDISQEISDAETSSTGLLTEEEIGAYTEEIEKEEVRRPGHELCQACLNATKCDGTTVHVGEDGSTFVCEKRVTKESFQELRERAVMEIPEAFRPMISETAGTRAEVLDLHELRLGTWGGELKAGYVNLGHELDRMLDPEQCLERCTTGFHYAFDSQKTTGEVSYVCTNPSCVSKKKAALTRQKNAQGQAKKRAEMAAIKTAARDTTTIDKPIMRILILAQLRGDRPGHYFGPAASAPFSPRGFWWNSLIKGEPATMSSDAQVRKIIDQTAKTPSDQLARLLVESTLLSMAYNGDVERYRIETTEPLNWMGIGITVKESGEGKGGSGRETNSSV